jgi:phosphatidylserine/phosphatidylglycerophosphate/cardiolipin synthase-like enzyme
MRDGMAGSSNHRFSWRNGNRFEILVDGSVFFPRMLAAIAEARHYILLEMYLVESGTVADRFIDALLGAADRGVRAYLLLDDFGASGLKRDDRARLNHANIHVAFFNPQPSHNYLYHVYKIFWHRAAHGLHRNHRKLLLVDGEIAFTGGTGITDEFDPPLRPETCWRETMVAIHGPVIKDWHQLFETSWRVCTASAGMVATTDPPQDIGTQLGRVVVSSANLRSELNRSLRRQLRRSQTRVWFATAYFVPSWKIRRNLKLAARTGVDVRLLLPGPVTDLPGVRYASRRYYGSLLKSGVRIFEYQARFLHAKTVLCDDWVTIGSSNFDRWNLQWNLEANQEIADREVATQVADMFAGDFANSREFTEREWLQRHWHLRALEWCWRQVERLTLKIHPRRRR